MRAAQDFDPLDIVEQEVGKRIVAAGRGWIRNPHAIDDHDCLRRIRTSDAQRGGGAKSAVAREADAGRAQQQVGQGNRLLGADCRIVKHGDGGGYLALFNRTAQGGHDNRAIRRFLGKGRGGNQGKKPRVRRT